MVQTLPSLEIREIKRRLAKGSAKVLLIHICGLAMAFLSQLVLTRALGSDGYGIYAVAFAWITVSARLCTFGFDTSLLRFVSSYRILEQWSLARGVIRYAERRVLLGGIGIFAAGIAVLWFSGDRITGVLRETIMIGLAVVPVWSLLKIRCATARALGGIVVALAPDRVVREGTLVVLVGAVSFVLSWKVAASQAMAATLVGTLTGLVIVTLASRRHEERGLRSGSELECATSEWRQTILPLVTVSVMQLLMTRTPVVMSGWMIGTTEAGYVALAANLAVLVSFPQTIVNMMLVPTVAMLFKREDKAGLQSVTGTATAWIAFLSLMVIVPLMIFAKQILLLFGPDFVNAASVLRILLFGQFINAISGSVLQIINMSGNERAGARILVVMAIVGVFLNTILIPTIGISGAALASALSLAGWNIAMSIFVYTRLDLMPSVFGIFIRRQSRGI